VTGADIEALRRISDRWRYAENGITSDEVGVVMRQLPALLAALESAERVRESTPLVSTPRGLMRQRDFLFGSGTDGTSVLCRWCGWKVNRRRASDPQKVFDLAETHDCSGVETAAERDARERAALEGREEVVR